jgi:hypothetical protein
MASDCLELLSIKGKFGIIDTAGIEGQRPTTITTARDAAVQLVEQIQKNVYKNQKEFVILFQTNNPYIQSQTLKTQAEVDKVLRESGLSKQGYNITIDGIGFGCKQDVATVHSELAVLVYLNWLASRGLSGASADNLLYQKRDNGLEVPVLDELLLQEIQASVVVEFLGAGADLTLGEHIS